LSRDVGTQGPLKWAKKA